MGERSDGTWAAKQVGLSVPRQNGKSQLIVARALAGALLFGETKIVISAHQQDTARETFSKFLEMRDASPALDERIDKVMNALNREYIRFFNGATIQFKARSVSGGRGFSADCLLLDEAQILGMPAWVSINSTMSARPNPQVWLLGTPPTPEDNGEVFTSVRGSALSGKSRTLAWLEWAALPGDDPVLESTRASGNPAWDTRINHEIVQGEFETYPPDRFALDRLGIWRSDQAQNVIDPDVWNSRAIGAADVPTGSPVAYSLDMNPDRDVTVGVAVIGGDTVHVEVAAEDKAVVDTRTLLDWLVTRCGRRVPVVIHSTSPAASLAHELRQRKVKVLLLSVADTAKACGAFYDAVLEARLTHFGQPEVDASLAGAKKKAVGDGGGWMWDFKRSTTNPAPIAALTLAHYGATLNTKTRGGSAVFA